MISQLPINLTAKAAEPGFSFLARLANANAGRSTYDFCVTTGLSKQAICKGEASALKALAHLTSSDPEALKKCSPQVSDRKFTMLNGCRFQTRSIRKEKMVICPACWLEQREENPMKPYAVAMRREWLPSPISCCLVHGVRLVGLPYLNYTSIYDHIFRCSLEPDWLRQLSEKIEEQKPTRFERLAVRQLETEEPICSWLPHEQIDVLERWCFGLGLLLEKGSTPARTVPRRDEPRFVDVGLRVSVKGRSNLMKEIDRALRKHDLKPRSNWLAAWSFQHPKPPERQQFAKLFKGLIDERSLDLLSASSDELPRKIEYSSGIQSIAEASGRTPAKVRQLLAKDGLIPAHGLPQQMSINKLLRRCREHVAAIDQSLSEKEAAELLGIGTHLFKGLVRDNFIVPMKTANYVKPRYDRTVLTKLVGKFLRPLETRADDDLSNMKSLQDVSFLLRCSASRVLCMLSSDQLQNSALAPDELGLGSLRFDIEEVKGCFVASSSEGLTVEELRSLLGLQYRHVTKLAKLGLLPSYQGRKKGTAIEAALVDRPNLELFLMKFQTARTWSRKFGLRERSVRRRLQFDGFRRAPEGDGIPIYRIEVISKL